jgi:hypothetical protein
MLLAVRLLLSAGMLLMLSSIASAHTRSESFSSWELDELTVRVTFTVPAREATRVPWAGATQPDLAGHLARYLEDKLGVQADGQRCPAIMPLRPLQATRGFLRVEGSWQCPSTVGLALLSDAFVDLAPGHTNFARLRLRGGGLWEYLFNERQRSWQVGELLQTGTNVGTTELTAVSLIDYLVLGIEHILSGLDHLAFLLAVILIHRRFIDIAFVVTGFTLGHSITLAVAVLGIFRPDGAVIEALIGLTIALVSAENIGLSADRNHSIALVTGIALASVALVSMAGIGEFSPAVAGGLALFSYCYLRLSHDIHDRARARATITMLFGLIHGFGFANVLVEAELPAERLLTALFGFNVGVEIGQIAAVAALLLFGRLATRITPTWRHLAADTVSAGLCGLGIFWFVGRAFV